MATAAARRSYTGPALFSYGFRPFFLLAGLWAALAVPFWVLAMSGVAPFDQYSLEWHKHEMLFGYVGAVVAGFLLTAVPNWTGRMPVMGAPLAGLVALWFAGRAAMLLQPAIGVSAGIVDSLFLIAFAAVVWREVLAGRNWRNAPVCALVTLLALANICFHLRVLVPHAGPVSDRAALGAAAILIALIGGRITPSFTRNWLLQRRVKIAPPRWPRLDMAGLVTLAVGVLAWLVAPTAPLSGALLVLGGLATLARLSRWHGAKALAEPLVWILHLGYGWLGVGVVLLGLSVLAPDVAPYTGAVHALTAGSVGVMTLAVMTRASRGHTGQPLVADRATTFVYLAINAAAALRVAAAFLPDAYMMLIQASGVLWTAAFGGFVLAYGPAMLRPMIRAR
jgi:uncharacterized protein involved in response to NO